MSPTTSTCLLYSSVDALEGKIKLAKRIPFVSTLLINYISVKFKVPPLKLIAFKKMCRAKISFLQHILTQDIIASFNESPTIVETKIVNTSFSRVD